MILRILLNAHRPARPFVSGEAVTVTTVTIFGYGGRCEGVAACRVPYPDTMRGARGCRSAMIMTPPSRILIVRPSALGDVCRTVPVLATLRRAWPEAAIDWVVQSEFAAAIACHPALNETIRFPGHDFGRW